VGGVRSEGTAGRLLLHRSYGNDEQTGFSDISLSGTRNGSDFATARVTTASMPPPTEFAGGFYGDYSALSAGDVAHPVWMDTRDTASVAIPTPYPELFTCRDSRARGAARAGSPPARAALRSA